MGARSFLYLQTVDFALGRKPIGEFVAWCKAALLGPVVSGSGNLCFAQPGTRGSSGRNFRRRDRLRQCRWPCADILEGRIPDGLSGGGPPGGPGMTGCLTSHDDDSLVITLGTSSAEPHRQRVATTGLPECRMVPAGLRGPRRQSNIKRGPADGVPRGGSDDRVTERSTPQRAAPWFGGQVRSRAGGRGVKESRLAN